MRNKITMEMSICQAENGFSLDELGERRVRLSSQPHSTPLRDRLSFCLYYNIRKAGIENLLKDGVSGYKEASNKELKAFEDYETRLETAKFIAIYNLLKYEDSMVTRLSDSVKDAAVEYAFGNISKAEIYEYEDKVAINFGKQLQEFYNEKTNAGQTVTYEEMKEFFTINIAPNIVRG